ncbi:MAG: hypothetical protein L7G98_06125 [Vulcanisaeta sp.]|nr:hypothetical protein [Vulcanisaeta sp.]
MMIDELIRRYGRYMGGIDYVKILNQLLTEEDRLREIEKRLAGVDTGQQVNNELLRNLELRQLIIRYVELKNEERRLLDLIKELKLRGYTRTEVEKAMKRLRKVRRKIRMMRKLMMMETHNNGEIRGEKGTLRT